METLSSGPQIVFQEAIKEVRRGKKPSISRLMLKAGYSPSSARALKVTKTKEWQELLDKIDDGKLLNKLYQIAGSKDNRAALAAIDQLFTLKDRKPAGKLKIHAYQEELERVKEGETVS